MIICLKFLNKNIFLTLLIKIELKIKDLVNKDNEILYSVLNYDKISLVTFIITSSLFIISSSVNDFTSLTRHNKTAFFKKSIDCSALSRRINASRKESPMW